MLHPTLGERVYVRPVSPQMPVQRAEGVYGQFLPAEGAEVLWDSFLHRRLEEGAIRWEPIGRRPAAAQLAAPEQPASPDREIG